MAAQLLHLIYYELLWFCCNLLYAVKWPVTTIHCTATCTKSLVVTTYSTVYLCITMTFQRHGGSYTFLTFITIIPISVLPLSGSGFTPFSPASLSFCLLWTGPNWKGPLGFGDKVLFLSCTFCLSPFPFVDF